MVEIQSPYRARLTHQLSHLPGKVIVLKGHNFSCAVEIAKIGPPTGNSPISLLAFQPLI
jgi:hypothetical protein